MPVPLQIVQIKQHPLAGMVFFGALPLGFVGLSWVSSGGLAVGLTLASLMGLMAWVLKQKKQPKLWLALLLVFPLFGFACLGFSSHSLFLQSTLNSQFSPLSAVSPDHWLGTDYEGRDLLATLIIGGQHAYLVASLSCLTALILGTFLGTLLTLKLKIARNIGLWVVQFFEIVPQLFFVLIIMGVYNFWSAGQRASAQQINLGLPMAGLAIGLSSLPSIARLVENRLLQLKATRFVTALAASNVPGWKITLYNLLWKNCIADLVVQTTFLFGSALLLESALSFAVEIGFGDLGTGGYLSWGKLLAEARRSILFGEHSFVVLAPALATLSSILGVNLLGDHIAQHLDEQR